MLADGASEAPSVRWHALKYSEFVREIGVTLYPAQQALTLVAFDGLEPCELPPELREYALAIFGPVDYLPASARRVLTAVCGGRGGKSYTLGALRLLHLSLTVPLDVLAPGEQAAAITIAPELDLAKQVLSYVGGALLSHPELIACIASKHQIQSLKEGHKLESITIRRPHDSRLVEIQCRAASRGGLGGRGRTLVGAHLDECAFFRDKDSGVVNDSEIFKAIVPRIVEGGQAVLTSTPYAESGVLYEEFKANHPTPGVACSDESPGRPHRAIAAHAPSILLRPDPIVYAALAAEEARDPLNASREFGARFLTAGESAYFDSAACSRIVEVAPCPARSFRTLGCDLAHVRNSAAYVAVERVPTGYRVLEVFELKPTGGPLRHSDVLAAMVETAKRWGIVEVVGDQHYAESAREACANAGLVFIDGPAGAAGKAEAYNATRRPLHEACVDLGGNADLRTQLRETRSKPLSGGGLSITSPLKATGAHGDLGSAFVLGMWNASRMPLPEPPPPPPAEADAWERRVLERANRNPDDHGPRWKRALGS
jgi:hypothetical protein